MRINHLIGLSIVCIGLMMGGNAGACIIAGKLPTEADLLSPPPDMLAIRAQIIDIEPHGSSTTLPHDDISIFMKVIKIYQGEIPKTFTVVYGACEPLPGRQGDIVPVFALKKTDGTWYAPSLWK